MTDMGNSPIGKGSERIRGGGTRVAATPLRPRKLGGRIYLPFLDGETQT